MTAWVRLSTDETAEKLNTDLENGLTLEEVQNRLEQYGPNELIDKGTKSVFSIIWEQLTDVMVVILIIAALVSAFIGEAQDTIVIIAIVLLNTVLGVSQEYRAEQAIAALKKLSVPIVRVRRGGQVSEISARDLVPGDVVELAEGNVIPADGRVTESANLRIEEAALTGESEPIEKHVDPISKDDVALGDQKNRAFMGTMVTYGRGVMTITETGMETELGKIADLIQGVESDQTPLQERLDGLGKTLAWLALIIIAIVFALGLFTSAEVASLWAEGAPFSAYFFSEDVQELFLTAISMAVAAVPEGLPAVVTITLALGSQRMLKRNALIRKLPAVETLGSVTVICSDKTGTLTENKMTVTLLDVAGDRETVELLAEQNVRLADAERQPDTEPPLRSLAILLKAVAHCNDGRISVDEDGKTRAIGDPTETALIVAAGRFGLHKAELDQSCPRVAEMPFSSVRKRMTTLHDVNEDSHESASPWAHAPYVAFTKGAVDGLLDIVTHVWTGEEVVPVTDEWRRRIEDANADLAQNGHRVLGAAFRPVNEIPAADQMETLENDLTFVGFAGMIDPPRTEVSEAVKVARTAGIRPIMITGDHPLTAQYIAKKLDITRNEKVMTGYKLSNMSEAELKAQVEDVSVYARVAPEHKLQIVQALQEKGQVVAMTGDGVNDAPALKRADIGVAMGITGTDVSKEAAEMVLLDDNFATIVAAVREGRTIYDNIRKFIKYVLSSNIGEIVVMLVAPFFGMPLPLIPIQILWVNLVTDGVPGLALAIEPEESGTMERSPYDPQESVFSRGVGAQVITTGIILGLVSLAVGFWGFVIGLDQQVWRTMTFTTLTLAQMGNALATRSFKESAFTIGIFSNRLMIGAIIVTFLLQMALIFVPFLQNIFRTAALSGMQLTICLAVSVLVYGIVEILKKVQNREK
ncbi:MAG: cation-translocating P-type ATPase [Ardenticatenaceae bacterium]|nr:cation-translocating P-type ATPase [Ardenticatenaceae bacterium]